MTIRFMVTWAPVVIALGIAFSVLAGEWKWAVAGLIVGVGMLFGAAFAGAAAKSFGEDEEKL